MLGGNHGPEWSRLLDSELQPAPTNREITPERANEKPAETNAMRKQKQKN